jgi:hypothetical protein
MGALVGCPGLVPVGLAHGAARRIGLVLEAELAAQPTQTAKQVLGIDPDPFQDALVAIRVDLIGQLSIGLLGLVVVAALSQ